MILLVMIITVSTLQVMLQTCNVSEVSGSPNSINLKKSIHKCPVGENFEIMFELCILYGIVFVYKLLATYWMCMVKVVVCLRMQQNAPQNT